MKKITLAIITTLLFVSSVNAFTVNNSLSDQINAFDGTAIRGEQLELDQSGLIAQKLFINPHFPTWRDMYLSTSDGIYINRQYNASWSKHDSLSELFPKGLTEIKFDGKYSTNLMMLAYDKSKIYMSYNNGDSWTDVTPEINEDILFADFGPNYSQNNQLYFITESGLYRKSMASGSVTRLIESTSPSSVKNFRYVRTNPSDSVFYVVNGDTLLKTENFGSSWLEKKFDSPIKDFEIKQKTLTSGHLMVLTDDNKIHYSTTGLSFFDFDLPPEISQIYSVDYIILTDLGFYITYTDGTSWSHLDYDSSYVSAISDYDFVLDGSQKSFYVTNGGTLYRDYDLTDEFKNYMSGVDTTTSYITEGTATSKNLLTEQFADNYSIVEATLSADGDLNSGTMDFYMTADGENYESVELGVKHTFLNPGHDLRWKVEMSGADSSVTPVLREVTVDYGMEEGCAGFSDVAVDDPHCPAIKYVKAQGIFEGYPDGTFGIDTEINRAETVKVITEGFNYKISSDNNGDLGFSDVEIGLWYMPYLNTAKTAGIIEGYPDGTFRPGDTVNYVEMMKIFLETAGAELADSAEGSAWYQTYVDYATENGLVVYEDFGAGMKRADVAELFYEYPGTT
ncbi:S-layer homology domain-containing protein [bacterium]|nr:S-layer homology domain-containing protein [bacterium]